MSDAALVTRLLALGFPEADARSRAQLLRLTASRLAASSSRTPVGAWLVPGRIEIVGKHTDYVGGRSLVAAAPRGFAMVAAPRDDGRVRVMDARYGTEIELAPDEEGRAFPGWTNYVSVVLRRLALNFPGASLGADIAIASDLPRAAGVSSSSALVVGIAHVLIARAALRERHEWRAAIADLPDLAGYLGAVENGFSFRALAGGAGVGTEGGSQDHTAILAAKPGAVSAFAYVPVRHLADAPMPDTWQFVLMNSGVHAGKASDVRDRFNRASRAIAALLRLWNAQADTPAPCLASALAARPDAADTVRQLVPQEGCDGFSAADLERRLAHFLGEDARVPLMLDAFRAADTSALAAHSLASQESAARDLGNQVDETSTLARVALESGGFASSSFGAGFGGSVWALVEGGDDEAAAFGARWASAYLRACPHMSHVDWFTARPAPSLVTLGRIDPGPSAVREVVSPRA